jgi:hypothetical protein
LQHHIRDEVFSITRACERLLSTELKLTDDERSLLEYYMNELSREFFSDKPTVCTRVSDQVALKSQAEA